MQSISDLKNKGFEGFKTISELQADHRIIPDQRGVYVVINTADVVQFAVRGTGGHFKGKDPNVPLETLKRKWLQGASVIYIGQAGGKNSAATLRKRLRQYLQFGMGKDVGHYGGRYIWQLAHCSDLLIAWKALLNEDPWEVEARLISEFGNHYGFLPFANLR